MVTGRQLIDGRYSNFDNNGHWLGYDSDQAQDNNSASKIK